MDTEIVVLIVVAIVVIAILAVLYFGMIPMSSAAPTAAPAAPVTTAPATTAPVKTAPVTTAPTTTAPARTTTGPVGAGCWKLPTSAAIYHVNKDGAVCHVSSAQYTTKCGPKWSSHKGTTVDRLPKPLSAIGPCA